MSRLGHRLRPVRARNDEKDASRPLRFVLIAPKNVADSLGEPDFAGLGLEVVARSADSWLVRGPNTLEALRARLEEAGLSAWSAHPEQFYRLA